jgi:hypothetical protein
MIALLADLAAIATRMHRASHAATVCSALFRASSSYTRARARLRDRL